MTSFTPAPSPFDRISLVPYQSDWPDDYRALVRPIRHVLPPGAVFHHIGSTAVPGLAAKDIIDVQVTVTSLDNLDTGALAGMGCIERSGLVDHAPPGRELPPSELMKRFFQKTDRPANVHIRVAGRFNQRYALLCRDYLRAHPVSSAAYAVIKQHLSTWFPDQADRYYDIKDPVFDIVIDGAEAWAWLTEWRMPPEDV